MTVEEDSERSSGLSLAAWTAVAATGLLLFGWFLVAWLALDRHVLDAAGESVGTAFVLLVVVSVIGVIRRR
ncbi:hypothetical protein [Luedemannella helvata]|uniref:NADH dehydrogenase subunit 6 n=1 Tax=Luedemannella helvata TaxID=349315 RepID=A0ABP4XIR8_9ACTN